MSVTLAVCENFAAEARLVVDAPAFRDLGAVAVRSFDPTCGRPPLTVEALRDLSRDAGTAGPVELFAGACCAALKDTCALGGPCTIHRLRQCFDLVAPAALVDHYLSTGAYLVTPGWLAHWRARLSQLGLDEECARALFGETVRRVVLLDTGGDPDSPARLREFSEFVGVPAETVPVGLSHLQLRLASLVLRRQLDAERADSLAALAAARRRSTECAAAFDLLGELTEISSENDAVERALSVFAMLFAPRQATFVTILDGAPTSAVSRPARDVDAEAMLARLRDAGGGHVFGDDRFLMPVRHLDELLGLVELEGVAAPERLAEEITLALTIAGVAGLSISNARKFEAIKKAEAALAIQNEHLVATLQSIREAEREREVSIEFLRMVNTSGGLSDLIRAAAMFFREQSGCEAVGIRLRDEDDFPYYEAHGFPPEFLLLENQICARDAAGNVRRDRAGNPLFECLCGDVIRGRTAPDRPFFTPGGSFWTNATTELFATATEADRKVRTRNRCHGEGYESVALLPLCVGGERFGLLQLNDRRKGMFTPELLALWERLAGYLAVAVAKARAEDSMREREARLRLLSETAGRLLATDDPEALVDDLCHGVMRHLDCQIFFNFLVDEPAGRLRLHASSGISAETAKDLEWVDFGVTLCGQVAAQQKRVAAEDILRRTEEQTAVLKSLGVQAFCGHPLIAHGRLIGTLSFATKTRARFRSAEIETMRTVADQVATAIERMQGQSALRAANAQLLDADRRKNEFLSVLSHELRNPLSPISNGVRILERAEAGSEQAARARDVIGRQAQHMTRLIDDLLDVTRISRGKIRLQRERVDLGRAVRATAEDHQEVFCRRGIDLDVSVGDEPLWAFGDPTRIAQMIGNLLQNAAKFTPRGGHVSLTAGLLPGGSAIIEVRDDGAGIQPELLTRLFEPFVQADRTLERSRGGLGLGLSLVKGLAELHGGTVSAASEGPGRGARFTIQLPLDSSVEPRPPPAPPTAPGRSARRVLVVEDNADVAQSLKDVLELSGHTVEIAPDGPEGVAKARCFVPDVVLCDIGLPGLDGYGVATAIRASAELGRCFLVALSGYAGPEDVARAKEAGFDRHLAKPPDPAALERVLREGREEEGRAEAR